MRTDRAEAVNGPIRGEWPIDPAADQALDAALEATFPCSDPIAVSCLAERAQTARLTDEPEHVTVAEAPLRDAPSDGQP